VIRLNLLKNQRWLERGILAIDRGQTEDEHKNVKTVWDNKRGWSAADAKLGSYLARYIRNSRKQEGFRLSGVWIERAKTLIVKYSGQLAKIAA
jgi:hypothetical protein